MSVTYLEHCDGNIAREIADEIDAGEITHAAFIYRTTDGAVCYRVLGEDEMTYLVGMIERAKLHIHCKDSYVLPDPPE